MQSLALKTVLTVVALVCLCSLILATTVRSSRISNNPGSVLAREKIVETRHSGFKESANLSGANMNGSSVKSATTCMAEDGGCNGAANYTLYPSTGCQSGFQNYGGTCKRRDSFIRGCIQHDGTYDPETCACTFD